MVIGDPVNPGDIIADKYRVRCVIGEGGVGVVVAADHLTLHQPVALKFLRSEIAREPQVIERFLREARAAASLRSEHVARVMDAEAIDRGPAYLVMELLDGRDFGAIVREDGPLPVDAAVDYLVQACEGVAEAHAQGIVHRDIKLANLFLTRGADGAPLVKVLDFGLSKIESSESRESLTSAHHTLGTPHYMSPEQMRSSRDVDARSDIWALGVVLYTFLAGRVPFPGTYLTEVCAAVLSGSAPKLVTLRPEVPAGLAAVVDRCLELEPEDRFQSVSELVTALAPFGGQASAVRVARIERLVAHKEAVAGRDRSPTTPRKSARGVRRRLSKLARSARFRWALALVALTAPSGLVLLVHHAQVAAARSAASPEGSAVTRPSPAPVVSAVSSTLVEPPPPAPAPSETSVAAQAEAPRVEAVPTTRGPLRHSTTTGARRAVAPPAPTARSSGAKATEEDVILRLPH
jgi:serine/threonine-protein kinase